MGNWEDLGLVLLRSSIDEGIRKLVGVKTSPRPAHSDVEKDSRAKMERHGRGVRFVNFAAEKKTRGKPQVMAGLVNSEE